MIQSAETPCAVITCDDCQDECWRWDDGTPHFASIDEARKYLADADWLFTDTVQVCSTCHAARVCAAEGHEWDDWRRSFRDELESFRVCDRCSAFDYTVAVTEGSA